MHGRSRMTIEHHIPSCIAGMEHVRFSPTRQALFAASAKRVEVFGASQEG